MNQTWEAIQASSNEEGQGDDEVRPIGPSQRENQGNKANEAPRRKPKTFLGHRLVTKSA